jgi:predicted phosphodiesterase
MAERHIAVLADIHGNRWALDAVLADIDRRGIQDIYDLGDSLQGPLDPAGTADILIRRGIPSICGNCDRELLDPAGPSTPTYAYDRSVLTPEHNAWLRALPPTRTLDDAILLCHGTPQSDDTYLLEEPTARGGVLRTSAEISASLAGTQEMVVCCAHSHVPRVVWLPDDRLVVNPGSVGWPAYENDTPILHIMEAGSPHARYAILTKTDNQGWRAELVAIPYDWAAAAQVAREHGREDVARALLTGRGE